MGVSVWFSVICSMGILPLRTALSKVRQERSCALKSPRAKVFLVLKYSRWSMYCGRHELDERMYMLNKMYFLLFCISSDCISKVLLIGCCVRVKAVVL